jgi:hypothetical protein
MTSAPPPVLRIFGLPIVGRFGANAHEDGLDTERRHGETIGNEVVPDHPDRLSANRMRPGDPEHGRMRLLIADDS